ncbi:hypothetical protein [Qipengyuania marisflavi]|uniref:MarR family transcriptional regulator n=1 Tax=Qipengyuania marisflavi TaxID=2486356 RepID=A0A5S3PE47_9SPHN|nr:hypothetical protein [Qipengyuania marisflavi]TMM49840.1 hypothetical protein FEV51_01170 [Qipengyuania marisflavi]
MTNSIRPDRRATDSDEANTHVTTQRNASDIIIEELHRAACEGRTLTVWDLSLPTGLTMPEVFAAVRSLELDKTLSVDDDQSDPFGATVRLMASSSASDTDIRAA